MPQLFTSYLCNKDDPIVDSIIKKWKNLNPEFDILYFSDSDVHDFFKKTPYFSTYEKMKNGVAIADLFRICYINKFGGYWFDIDIEPFKLEIKLDHKIQLFDCGYGNISYMLIGGHPNQLLFDTIIKKVISNIENNVPVKKDHIMDITGPRVLQKLILNKLNIANKDGNFKGTIDPKIFLENSDFEFCYCLNVLTNVKTNAYNQLQQKYKKMYYYRYNFV